ncbi:MAG TPA: serine hydrolase domain-containing protein [Acidimicrobiia bacterium]|nr:serine hydrolase domain-containing protein [Acidimicrobiia bacterium]
MRRRHLESRDERLSSLLRLTVERKRHIRHGLLGVAFLDRGENWLGAHGVLDPEGTPAEPGSRYPIASVTKLYTATITMRLVEDGRLRLEDRMVDVLPEEVTRRLHVRKGVDRTDLITVENLLSHTSGLADYYAEAPKGSRSAEARLLAGEDVPVPFEEVVRLIREDLPPHFEPQPVGRPRRRARYADTNYQLLGTIVEEVTGKGIADLFDEVLFTPLGLDDTSSYPHVPRSGSSPEPDARIWAGDVVLRPEGALRFQKADGGIVSTLSDQLRFITALVSDEIFVDPSTWARMASGFNRVFFPVEYGLGVMRYAPPRWMSPGFRMPALLGHSGSTATWLFHCPELNVAVAGAFDVAQPALPYRFLPRVLREVSLGGAG